MVVDKRHKGAELLAQDARQFIPEERADSCKANLDCWSLGQWNKPIILQSRANKSATRGEKLEHSLLNSYE